LLFFPSQQTYIPPPVPIVWPSRTPHPLKKETVCSFEMQGNANQVNPASHNT
jgi:hypothetical protein